MTDAATVRPQGSKLCSRFTQGVLILCMGATLTRASGAGCIVRLVHRALSNVFSA
jgi:hypothetical protein